MKRKPITNTVQPIFALMQKNGVGFLTGTFRTDLSDTEITQSDIANKEYKSFNIVFSNGTDYICELCLPNFSEKATIGLGAISNSKGKFGGLSMYLPLNDHLSDNDIVFIIVELKFHIPTAGEFMAYISSNNFWSAKKSCVL